MGDGKFGTDRLAGILRKESDIFFTNLKKILYFGAKNAFQDQLTKKSTAFLNMRIPMVLSETPTSPRRFLSSFSRGQSGWLVG